MRKQFDHDLSELSDELLRMAAGALDAIRQSVRALTEQDAELAKQVVAGDRAINELEKIIEQHALRIILKYQPVADDLRNVTCALKMITDIERIADQAADISGITLNLLKAPYPKEIARIPALAAHVSAMVQRSVRSFLDKDAESARAVILSDDAADEMFARIKDELVDYLKQSPASAEQILYFLMIAKYLERVGDHAVNIAEWVIFDLTGVHKRTRIL